MRCPCEITSPPGLGLNAFLSYNMDQINCRVCRDIALQPLSECGLHLAFGLLPHKMPEVPSACQSCAPAVCHLPVCLSMIAAAQAGRSYGTRGLRVLSHNPKRVMGTILRLVQISIIYIGTMLQQLRAEVQFALLIQVSVRISHCRFAHGDISMTVSLGA